MHIVSDSAQHFSSVWVQLWVASDKSPSCSWLRAKEACIPVLVLPQWLLLTRVWGQQAWRQMNVGSRAVGLRHGAGGMLVGVGHLHAHIVRNMTGRERSEHATLKGQAKLDGRPTPLLIPVVNCHRHHLFMVSAHYRRQSHNVIEY